MTGPGQELDGLRHRIAEVDGALIDLLAERLALAERIGAAKREAGVPVRSYAIEAEVRDRLRRLGTERGLEHDVADALARVLISEAVRRQEATHARPRAVAQRVCVVGGAGRMGRWLARFFLNQGHAVSICDPDGPVPDCETAPSLRAGARDADVVLVATPLAAGAAVLAEVLAARPRALVADVFSLKSHVLDVLREAAARGQRVASLHPLFGPGVRTLSGRVVAVCDCGDPAAADQAAALFADTALTITRLPVAEHDRFMMYVLGLSHLTAILFFTTLARSGVPFSELATMASTTFFKEARTAAEVARESPHLYYDIQHLNHHTPDLYAQVRRALTALADAAAAGDPSAFVALMEQGRAYFPGALPAELG
jgi:chorismate mutase/prephenate dehydrogenase